MLIFKFAVHLINKSTCTEFYSAEHIGHFKIIIKHFKAFCYAMIKTFCSVKREIYEIFKNYSRRVEIPFFYHVQSTLQY